MPRHFEKRVLPYSCEELFQLVADIEHYPDFLPWCFEAEITRRDDDYIHACLVVGYKSFRETFASHVHLEPPHRITVTYGGGPLKQLSTKWAFTQLEPNKTEVAFFVSFEFKSLLFNAMMDVFFDYAFRSMVRAFEKRAQELYGEHK